MVFYTSKHFIRIKNIFYMLVSSEIKKLIAKKTNFSFVTYFLLLKTEDILRNTFVSSGTDLYVWVFRPQYLI